MTDEHGVGELVSVRPSYRGGGAYERDEFTGGPWTVVGQCGPNDRYLARGDWRHNPGGAMWDVIVHVSRLEAVS